MLETVNRILEQETCTHCFTSEFVAIQAMKRCCICGALCCKKKCLTKLDDDPPDILMNKSFKNERPFFACKRDCYPIFIKYSMNSLKEEYQNKFDNTFGKYFQDQESHKLFFSKPDYVIDSSSRKVLRAAQIAEGVATVSGFSATFSLLKYAYIGGEIVKKIISSDLLEVLSPLMDSLSQYGIKGPRGILRLYYLGCQHVKEHINDLSLEYASFVGTAEGVIAESCPEGVLEYLGTYVDKADCLYSSNLPAPHDTNDWNSWYLSRITIRQEYTVLACINETTKLPNGVKCPAFALLARYDVSKGQREAILAIRGSHSTMDWSINLDENACPFSFYSREDPSLPSSELICTTGWAHQGMYKGVMGILDSYSMRSYLTDLFVRDYRILFVGHSLGAGIAALAAAEFQNGLRLSSNEQIKSKIWNNCHSSLWAKGNPNRAVSGICFATPPCVSSNIADMMLKDGVITNCINVYDVIPRSSHSNFAKLAEEILAFSSVADQWLTDDTKALKNYAFSMGMAGSMAPELSKELDRNKDILAVLDEEEHNAQESLALVEESEHPDKVSPKSGTTPTAAAAASSSSSALPSKSNLTDGVNAASAYLASSFTAMSGFLSSSKVVPSSSSTSTVTTTVMATATAVQVSPDASGTVIPVVAKAVKVSVAAPPMKPPRRDTGNGEALSVTSSGSPQPPLLEPQQESQSLPQPQSEGKAVDPALMEGTKNIPLVVPGLIVQLYENEGN